jgi:peptidoglycan/xylan/chitin deacetylase (PgdA/CDA1 family)
MTPRELARLLLDHALGAMSRVSLGRRNGLVVLTYHRVLPRHDGSGEYVQPGMQITPATLQLHLSVIGRHFRFTHLDEWLVGPRDGRACAVTFDDGWRDNYEFAFPVLSALGVPAMIFLATGYVGTTRCFWPERLSRVLGRMSRDPARVTPGVERRLADLLGIRPEMLAACDRNSAIERAKRLGDETIGLALAEIEAAMGDAGEATGRMLDWQQVRKMAAGDLVRFGSHTVEHRRLGADISDGDVRAQLLESKREIEHHTGKPASLFCYPNGAYDERIVSFVRSEYLGACTTDRGWNDSRADPYRLRRIGLHEGAAPNEQRLFARLL